MKMYCIVEITQITQFWFQIPEFSRIPECLGLAAGSIPASSLLPWAINIVLLIKTLNPRMPQGDCIWNKFMASTCFRLHKSLFTLQTSVWYKSRGQNGVYHLDLIPLTCLSANQLLRLDAASLINIFKQSW